MIHGNLKSEKPVSEQFIQCSSLRIKLKIVFGDFNKLRLPGMMNSGKVDQNHVLNADGLLMVFCLKSDGFHVIFREKPITFLTYGLIDFFL